MKKLPFKLIPNESRTSVDLVPDHGEVVTLDTRDFQNFMEALGILRAKLLPQSPTTPPDPRASLLPLDRIEGRLTAIGSGVPSDVGCVFLVHSPTFGWQSMPVSAGFCKGLAEWLEGKTGELSPPPGTLLQ